MWYLATILPVPKNIETKINFIIEEILWDNKNKHLLKYSTRNRPKHKGGLNILPIQIQSHALKLKYIIELSNDENHSVWNILTRYLYTFKLTKTSNIFNNLKANNTPKDLHPKPDFFDEILKPLQTYVLRTKANLPENRDKYVNLITTKLIRQNIQEKLKNLPIQYTWQNETTNTIHWTKNWIENTRNLLYPKILDVNFKIKHRILPTNFRLHNLTHFRQIVQPTCPHCEHNETITHILLRCPDIQEIKTYVTKLINLYDKNFHMNILTILGQNKTKYYEMTKTILYIYNSEIWTRRNQIKFKEIEAKNKEITKNKIKQKIIQTIYKTYRKKKKDITEFVPNILVATVTPELDIT